MEMGLTQKDLAHILGYKSVSTLSHLETGRKLPSIRTAMKLEAGLSRLIGSIYPRLFDSMRDPVARRRERFFRNREEQATW